MTAPSSTYTGKVVVAKDQVCVDLKVRTHTRWLIDTGFPELDVPLALGESGTARVPVGRRLDQAGPVGQPDGPLPAPLTAGSVLEALVMSCLLVRRGQAWTEGRWTI